MAAMFIFRLNKLGAKGDSTNFKGYAVRASRSTNGLEIFICSERFSKPHGNVNISISFK